MYKIAYLEITCNSNQKFYMYSRWENQVSTAFLFM